MDITQVSIIHHIGLILLVLWLLTSMNLAHPVFFFLSLLYLYMVHERYTLKLRRRLQCEERKSANQRRLLSDSESVRWLNHAVEKIWPICMEQIASQQFLLPVIPWFLEKYKPWTAKEAAVQHLYLGRRPPMFTDIRVLSNSADDDHLVIELGMNFLSADDLSIILAVQPRMGFGMWANMHVTGMHVEGKVLVGVKFLRNWPFLGRMRVCFVEPPYFQMRIKPIFNHGIDVTELPGIAGWLDNMLAVAFEQTLVEPNMLVVDVEKFASSPTESWFTVDEKTPIAHAKVEIIEAADLKPSDMNGFADPYVKGHVGPYRFRTKTQKKTLTPRWFEEFRVPITSWESPNMLVLELLDKDHIFDDVLGDCAINISELRGGQRHDKWLPLLNIKTGRLHLAITVLEGEYDKMKDEKTEDISGHKTFDDNTTPSPAKTSAAEDSEKIPKEESRHLVDQFEAIDIKGQEKTGIWVHHPGSEVSQSWEPRKGRARRPETRLQCESNEGFDSPKPIESDNSSHNDYKKKVNRLSTLKKGMHKIGSIFHRDMSPRGDGDVSPLPIPTPRANIRAVNSKETNVRVILDDSFKLSSGDGKVEKDEGENSKTEKVKDFAKNVMKKPVRSFKNVMGRKGSFGASEDRISFTDENKPFDEGSFIDSCSPISRGKEESIKEKEDEDKREMVNIES